MTRPQLSREAETLLQHSLSKEFVRWHFERASDGTWMLAAAGELVDAGLVELLRDGWACITDAGRVWLVERKREGRS